MLLGELIDMRRDGSSLWCALGLARLTCLLFAATAHRRGCESSSSQGEQAQASVEGDGGALRVYSVRTVSIAYKTICGKIAIILLTTLVKKSHSIL